LVLTIVFSCLNVLSQKIIATIPFSLVEKKNIISVNIEGQDSLLFVFDSGAALTTIDSATAIKFGFKPQKRIISGIYTEFFIPDVELSISSFNIGKTELKVSKVSAHLKIGVPIIGVIGKDILSNYVTEVNYDDMIITLWDKFSIEAKTICSIGSHPIFASINCTIKLSNGETITGDFIIDSGAPVALIFNTPYVEKHNLIELCQANTDVNIQNHGHSFNATHGEVVSVSFYDHSFNEVPVIFSQATSGFLSISRYAGLIGNEFLRRFNIIWDYKNDRISLSPSRFYNDKFPQTK